MKLGIILLCIFLAIASLVLDFSPGIRHAAAQSPSDMPAPTPTYDPLAIPTLPDNPTQEELGEHVYYYNCMPCHGDQGQGLTDAWRQVWEEDHRDCWGRGCHGGRGSDEGFPIPTVIPAIILDGDALQRYTTPQELFAYLQSTHPPQAPGKLDDGDYQALVAYLWVENGKPQVRATLELAPTPSVMATPVSTPTVPAEVSEPKRLSHTCSSAGMILAALLAAGVVIVKKSRRSER